MKALLVTLVGLAISSPAFAGSYSFSCSNSDGTIIVDGAYASVQGKNYEVSLELKNIEAWASDKDAFFALKENGPRTVLVNESSSVCRDTGHLVFAQALQIVEKDTSRLIAIDYFTCEESYATTMGGLDNPECASGEE